MAVDRNTMQEAGWGDVKEKQEEGEEEDWDGTNRTD